MEQILLDIREWNRWMKERFIDKDFITLEELLGDYEDLIFENDNLKEKIEEKDNKIEELQICYK